MNATVTAAYPRHGRTLPRAGKVNRAHFLPKPGIVPDTGWQSWQCVGSSVPDGFSSPCKAREKNNPPREEETDKGHAHSPHLHLSEL